MATPSRTSSGRALFWSAALSVSAVTLTVGNKQIMHSYSFPMSLLLLQNTTAAVVLAASVLFSVGGAKWERFTRRQLVVVSGAACIATVQLSARLIALPYVSIATVTVMGNSRALLQSGLECALLGERFGWKEIASLALISVGSLMYAEHDVCVGACALGEWERWGAREDGVA